jgi:hypothetical protein
MPLTLAAGIVVESTIGPMGTSDSVVIVVVFFPL